MVRFSFADARSAFKLEGFKFAVYVLVPIGIGVYYSVPDHWVQSLTAHAPLETPVESDRRQRIRDAIQTTHSDSSSRVQNP